MSVPQYSRLSKRLTLSPETLSTPISFPSWDYNWQTIEFQDRIHKMPWIFQRTQTGSLLGWINRRSGMQNYYTCMYIISIRWWSRHQSMEMVDICCDWSSNAFVVIEVRGQADAPQYENIIVDSESISLLGILCYTRKTFYTRDVHESSWSLFTLAYTRNAHLDLSFGS